ncbi:TrkH family potassium uptake protein [Clostridium sp.]|uniref:TrkH family potassium uptake protein n=1 Tax=Clostridium sp. TaxID=1506 RepID=UPI002FC8C0A3
MDIKLKDSLRKFRFTPVQIVVIGFAITILIGAMILSLPIAAANGESTPFVDCLFTATSAVCVTGLVTVDTGTHWSYFGKTVIVLLIQVGGLGFMSFATLFSLIIGKKITLRERLVMQESLNSNSLQGLVKLVKYILIFTFSIELAGAILFSTQFIPDFGIAKGIYYSIFHGISFFCNAGFDLMGNFKSLTEYHNNSVVILTASALIAIGGLGFIVWDEIYHYKRIKRFSLHSKVVLSMTGILIITGTVLFFMFEYNNPGTMQPMSLKGKVLSSILASISPRTAGVNSVNLAAMTSASILLTIILMFIGGSPGSTAGGIKTTTFGILFMTVVSVIKGREDTEYFKKRINKDIVYKALAVTVIGLGLVIAVTMILSFTERGSGRPFEYYLYEATSAFGTVGLTLGLTQELTTFGKILVALTMYAGRVGPLSIALALTIKKHDKGNTIRYPEDKILVG